jgi:hypothetical protein
MADVAWPALRHPPLLFVRTGPHEVGRVSLLTAREARAVIVRLADELESAREEIAELKARADA